MKHIVIFASMYEHYMEASALNSQVLIDWEEKNNIGSSAITRKPFKMTDRMSEQDTLCARV